LAPSRAVFTIPHRDIPHQRVGEGSETGLPPPKDFGGTVSRAQKTGLCPPTPPPFPSGRPRINV